MKKRRIILIALVASILVTLPEFFYIIDYVKGPKELGELVLGFLVRWVLWIIIIKVLVLVYKLFLKVFKNSF